MGITQQTSRGQIGWAQTQQDKRYQANKQGGFKFNPGSWASWDTEAGRELQEIQNYASQMQQIGAQPDASIQSLQEEMWRAMGTDTKRANEIRIALKEAYRNAYATAQKNLTENQIANNQAESDIGYKAPDIEGMGGWGGVNERPGFQDYASMFGVNTGAPGFTADPNAGELGYTFDPSMLTGTTGNQVNFTTGYETSTGQGTVGNMGGVDYEAPTYSGPDAQGPTAGTTNTGFAAPGSSFNTGDPALDTVLSSIMQKGGSATEIEKALSGYFTAGLGEKGGLSSDEEAELADIKRTVMSQAEKIAGMGLSQKAAAGLARGGKQVNDLMTRVSDQTAKTLMTTELGYRTGKATEKRESKSRVAEQAIGFINAVRTGDTNLAKTILDARSGDLDRELSTYEMEVKYGLMEENIQLLRDNFTEDQRKSLRQEGFTERQIVAAEQELQWRTAFESMKYAADHNLAVRNTDIAEKAQMGELEISQLVNKNNIDIATRTQQLAEQMGVWQAGMDRDNLNLLKKKMELEYGINVNAAALNHWVTTGKFTMDVLNADRSYDLSVAGQRDDWLKSQASLNVQKELALSEMELKSLIAGKELDMERDKMLTSKLLTLTGMERDHAEKLTDRLYDKWKTEFQAKKNKKNMWGQILGQVVSTGLKIAASYLAGNASGGSAASSQSTDASAVGDWTASEAVFV